MDDDSAATRQIASDWQTFPNAFSEKYHAHIRLNADDVPEAMDFRCLIGLQVHVSSVRGVDRQKRIFDAVAAAGPDLVLAAQGDDLWVHKGAKRG
jgi:hypothetical protein